MKNFLVSLTAVVLFLVVLCAKQLTEPQSLTESEMSTLKTSVNEVISEYPIKPINYVIDKNCLRLKVTVPKSTPKDELPDIEEELQREILHEVVDNGYLEESAKLIGKLKLEVNFIN